MKHSWKQCLATLTALAVGVAGAAEAARPGDKPLVVNGDLSLTTLDFDAYMERVPADRRNEFRAEFSKINPTVDGLWIRRALAARAVAAGLDKDPIISARIRQAQEDILADVFLGDVARKVVFPNLEPRARELYKANLKEFTTPEYLNAQHILVNTKNRSRDEAAARAREAYERAKAGEDFAKLADEFSDSVATRDIVAQPMSAFEKPIPEIVAKTKDGEITAPIETRYGFHVIKVASRVAPRIQPFEDVKDDLIAIEKQKLMDDAKTAAAENVRSDPKTTLYIENVRGLKSEFKIPNAEDRKKTTPNYRP
jgi:peptidyl-prolyl cis-trans isomerase C